MRALTQESTEAQSKRRHASKGSREPVALASLLPESICPCTPRGCSDAIPLVAQRHVQTLRCAMRIVDETTQDVANLLARVQESTPRRKQQILMECERLESCKQYRLALQRIKTCTEREALVRWVRSVYMRYNPSKVSKVDDLLRQYDGREFELVDMICKKYRVSC
mmetsp:Transcript_38893/g.77185  ORF Transcript_38893/g.77185 Transcript_38893/m.77185 type:complete len:166 (-) Transcript_38893:22-519(-)